MKPDQASKYRGGKYSAGRIPFMMAVIACFIFLIQAISCSSGNESVQENAADTSNTIAELFTEENVWTAPDTSAIPAGESGSMIRYGRKLIIHTSKFFGPNGSVSKTANGMNCQSCHLEAGTRPYGNNLGSASTTYPKFLPRSNSVISLAQKINECFSRSLNGTPIDTTSNEMNAYLAYINWLGQTFHKDKEQTGSGGIKAPKLIDRAADPEKGEAVFELYCVRCHGKDGHGQLVTDVLKDITKQQGGTATKEDLYFYPPLWGNNSFNGVATLYRLSKFAGFVKSNMPYPVNYNSPVLTDEQAWDVAAYVNSRERPIKDYSKDYISDISKKPYDFPFPPYADQFSDTQHKFGPYTDMPSAHKAH
ncbi:MAG: c-type cytochrome [Bacteroidota bacterium]